MKLRRKPEFPFPIHGWEPPPPPPPPSGYIPPRTVRERAVRAWFGSSTRGGNDQLRAAAKAYSD